MIYKLLIGLAALFGLFQLSQIKNLFAQLIILAQTAGIVLTLVAVKTVSAGFTVYMMSLIAVILYAFMGTNFKQRKRLYIAFPTFLILFAHFFRFQHFPGAGWLGFLGIIPVLVMVKIITTDLKSYRNELGFLTIIATDALITFALSFNLLFAKMA